MVIKTPSKVWYKRVIVQAVFSLICLGIAYLLVSRAIDTGSWWEYFGAIVFLCTAINLLINVIKLSFNRE